MPGNAEISSDLRLTYWLKNRQDQNFGDYLSELLFQAITRKSWLEPAAGRAHGAYDVIHLIGSVISGPHIQRDMEHTRWPGAANIVFWGCGKRDEARIDPELLKRCDIRGVRGPLTRQALDLPAGTILGDTGLLLPLLYQPRPVPSVEGKTICVPHFLDKLRDTELLARTGADMVVRPNIPASIEALRQLIDIIANARFVLAGALHAAITACAFGTPFSYFDSGYIDVPFKWVDFAQSIGVPPYFAGSVADGLSIHQAELKGKIRRPPLAPILSCAPFQPSRKLMQLAQHHDARAG